MGRDDRRDRGPWAHVCVLSIVLAACGSPARTDSASNAADTTVGVTEQPATTPDPVEAVPTTDGNPEGSGDLSEWGEIELGRAVGDDIVSMTELDGDVWMARLTELRDEFEVRDLAGERIHRLPASDRSTPPQLAGTPFGLLLITSDYQDFVPTSRLSTDGGATWTESRITDRPFDVSGVTVVDGALLAPGAFRSVENPGTGPFTPGMFRSDDGVTWTEVPLDPTVFDTSDSYLGPIVDTGDRLVMSGTRDDGEYRLPAMFESSDRGATWQIANDSGPAPTAVVAAGRTLVGVNSFLSTDEPALPISTNTDRIWTAADLSRFTPPFQYASTFPLSGGPAVLVSFAVEPTTEYCYDHVDECGPGLAPVLLLVSDDGSVVSVDLGTPAGPWPTSGFVASDGSIHVVTARGERLVVRTWDAADGPVPTVPDVEPFVPSGPPVVEWGSELAVGSTSRFPLGTHCGIDVLGEFNGQYWWIVGQPESAYDDHRTDMSQRLLGEITVVDATTIEYRIDGELIATYAPSAEEPPGCA